MATRSVKCEALEPDSTQEGSSQLALYFKLQASRLLRIPDELLLIILSFLPITDQIILGFTCKQLGFTIQPHLLINQHLHLNNTSIHNKTYLHIIKRDLQNGWLCYRCGIIHITVLHPSISSPKYLSNLREWLHYIPPIPPLPRNTTIRAPEIYGIPNCAAYEVSPYVSLLSPSSTPYIEHKLAHSYPTPTCDLRIATTLQFIRLPSSSTLNTLNRYEGDAVKILSHTRHTILFHPLGIQSFTPSSILASTSALKLDICQHVRLSGDPTDPANILQGMLTCAAKDRSTARPAGHEECRRRRRGWRRDRNRDMGLVERRRNRLGEWEADWERERDGDVDRERERNREREVDRGVREEHWTVCGKCGAEVDVWFDSRGLVSGRVGDGVLRIDVWKELTVEEGDRQYGSIAGWERRVGPVERQWRRCWGDFWMCLDDRENENGALGILDATYYF